MGKDQETTTEDEEKINYNRLRNQIRGLTRKSKKIIEKEIAKNAKSNPKAFWKYSQSKLKTRSGIPDLVIEDDEDEPKYTKNDQEKTETFLRNFSSVFTIESTNEMPHFDKRIYACELNDINITESTGITKLNKLKK